MLTNNLQEWQTHLNEQLVKLKLSEDTPLHAIIYTDGGCRPNPGSGGVGIHGYFYTPILPKTGYGTKGFKPTCVGYVNSDRPIDDPEQVAVLADVSSDITTEEEKPVTVIAFFDIACSLEGLSTNNSSELTSFLQALVMLGEVSVKSARFILDSRYVLNNTTNNLEQWAKNRWRGSDGSEIKNRYLWESVYEQLNKVKSHVDVILEWTKGHSDDSGNMKADQNASAASITASCFKQISFRRLFAAKGYWNPESEYHRFFTESRWYFLTHTPLPIYDTLAGKFHVYYTGNHGTDDDMFAKASSDTVYSITCLKQPDEVLNQLKEEVDKFVYLQTKSYFSLPVIGQLNNIFKPSVYRDLKLSECKHLYKQNEKPELYAPPEVLLTTERNPPLLAARAFNCFTGLELKLLDFLNNSLTSEYVLNDITSFIYEQVETKKKTVLKVSSNLAMDTQSIKLSVDYTFQSQAYNNDVILTCGLDIPKRNLFAALSDKSPKVYVLTWPEPSSRKAFRYATIVTSDDAVGIWAGVYSNLRIVI